MYKIISAADLGLDDFQEKTYAVFHGKIVRIEKITQSKIKLNDRYGGLTTMGTLAELSGVPLTLNRLNRYKIDNIGNRVKIVFVDVCVGYCVEYFDEDLTQHSIKFFIKYEHQLQNFLNLINAPDSSTLIDYLRKI